MPTHYESGRLLGSASSGGATSSSLVGFEGLLECGNFMHTELLYPHRMILEDL